MRTRWWGRRKSHRRYVKYRQQRGKGLVPKILLLVGVILIIIFFFGDHGIYKLYDKKKEKEQLLEEIDRLREQQQKLLGERERLESDLEYIEQLAREKHRMAKPGEKVFRVIEKPEE